MDMKTRDAMMKELRRLDKCGGLLEAGGVSIVLPQGYLSGCPYLLSSSFTNAFAFKNQSQAEGFIDKFRASLQGAKIVQRQPA